MSLRFYAVPGPVAAELSRPPARDAVLEPQLQGDDRLVERALSGVEYRNLRARDQIASVLSVAPRDALGRPAAIFARPPMDLPALLRLADQLDGLAREEGGERALLWRCGQCMSRYAVPVPLVRPVTIRCDHCQAPVELRVETSLGEEPLLDPYRASINTTRQKLASFFRESMARGWPVVVTGVS